MNASTGVDESVSTRDTAGVRFAICPEGWDGPRILAEISANALRDVFGARGGVQGLLAAWEEHFAIIDAQAVRDYRDGRTKAVRLEAAAAEREQLSEMRYAHDVA